ncbi:YciI family protein [Maritalea porphyrae]|uniref:YCII-related domain-containing protein n=1 Tax=Maritalea porphyrae TaxID=880732 RepID=A0ABQ5UMP1_9HYPH|nr:YciI family protein [Maritalea porphyrae]GLQ16483.1 hypothetical protein GCM10007879_07320 [Maritalea porphyrae]
MFVILLKFADKSKAKEHMQGHNDWIDQGIKDGTFLVVGSLQPNLGGAIISVGSNRADIEARINQDPFVKHSVVDAEILEITPNRIADAMAGVIQ